MAKVTPAREAGEPSDNAEGGRVVSRATRTIRGHEETPGPATPSPLDLTVATPVSLTSGMASAPSNVNRVPAETLPALVPARLFVDGERTWLHNLASR